MITENPIRSWPATRVLPTARKESQEDLAVEEPLEISLEYSSENGRMRKAITVTLRTPGSEHALALGFLYAEGIIQRVDQVDCIKNIGQDPNRVLVILKEDEKPDLRFMRRNFLSTASCGLCGKISADAVYLRQVNYQPASFSMPSERIYQFPRQFGEMQQIFSRTGGIHAAALLDYQGDMILVQEDIGRHNAVDKVIGAALQVKLDLSAYILLLSGRAGFELIQKAVRAGIGFVAAMGAPSSMAVELAEEAGLTLVGFLKSDRYTIYSNPARIVG